MQITESKTQKSAFTLAELLVLMSLTLICGALILPAFASNKCKCVRINCASNLKQAALAFRIWEDDNAGQFPMQILTNQLGAPLYTAADQSFRYFQVMSNEISNPKVMVCPADKSHAAATNFPTDFSSRHLSYFAGLDATEAQPYSFLAGDSNITNGTALKGCVLEIATNQLAVWTKKRHRKAGNIALADGSVIQGNDLLLWQSLQYTARATNRLLMP